MIASIWISTYLLHSCAVPQYGVSVPPLAVMSQSFPLIIKFFGRFTLSVCVCMYSLSRLGFKLQWGPFTLNSALPATV